MSSELYIIASCISKIFIFWSRNLNNHKFFKKVVRSKSSQIFQKSCTIEKFSNFFLSDKENFPISFTNCLRMVPWTPGKNCGYQVFLAISRFDFQNVCVKPHFGPFFQIFGLKKIKTQIIKTFAKTVANTKTDTKNFCDTPLLFYGTRCGIVLHNSTIIFRNANTTHCNEQKTWLYFRGYSESIFAESLILKIPQPEYRSVFEMIKIPRNGCQDMIPKVIIPNEKIPNAKITNAIIPNVTYNGSPN